MELLTITLYLLAFFVDTSIAMAIGYKLGPERARKLICNDPEYKSTKLALEQTQRDMLVVRHDFEAMRDTILQAQKNTGLTVIEALKSMPKPELSANITLPVTMQDAVQRDLRAIGRSVFKEVMTADIEELLVKAMRKAMEEQGLADLTPEQAKQQVDKMLLEQEIDAFAERHGIDPAYANVAKRAGRGGIRLLQMYLPPEIQEAIR